MMTIKHYKKSILGNALLTIAITLSPRTPRSKRRTLTQTYKRNNFHYNNRNLLSIIKK